MNSDHILADYAITIALTRFTVRQLFGVVNLSIVGSVITQYRDVLSNFVYDAMNGRMSAVDFRRAHKALIRAVAPDAFIAGLRDGGAADDDIVSFVDDNRAMLADWITNQVGHTNDFAAACADVQGDKDKRGAILDRTESWVNALRGLADNAAVIAKGDPALTFNGDDGKENCADCRRYKGKRHRRAWWAKRGLLERNGNPNFGCGRWDGGCFHGYYYDSGELAIV